MKEFLFKALFEHPKGMRVWKESETNFIVDSSTFGFVRKTEWLQYVRKKDKNGLKIFEGDVFKFKFLEELHKPIELIGAFSFGSDLSFEIDVFYDNDLYGNSRYTCLHYVDNGVFFDFEIIGNIHETPDFVEKYIEKTRRKRNQQKTEEAATEQREMMKL